MVSLSFDFWATIFFSNNHLRIAYCFAIYLRIAYFALDYCVLLQQGVHVSHGKKLGPLLCSKFSKQPIQIQKLKLFTNVLSSYSVAFNLSKVPNRISLVTSVQN